MMIEAVSHVNWLPVLAASVAHFVLGGVWFALVIAKDYQVALGIADRQPQKPGALFLIGPFLCSTVTIIASAALLRTLGISTYGESIGFGALVGLGYLAPMTLNIAINPLFPRPFYYALLNVPFFFIGSILACTILMAFS